MNGWRTTLGLLVLAVSGCSVRTVKVKSRSRIPVGILELPTPSPVPQVPGPVAEAPQVTSPTVTRSARPVWNWTSSLAGSPLATGAFRFALDAQERLVEAREVTALTFAPSENLADGRHILFVQERLSDGEWSPVGQAAVLVDTTRPQFSFASVNGGESATRMSSLPVQFSFSDALSSNGWQVIWEARQGSCPADPTGTLTWSPGLSTGDISLPSGDGAVSLCAWARDGAGNVSAVASATVTVDRVAPEVSSGLTGGGTTVVTPAVSLDVTTSDASPSSGGLAVAWAEKSAATCPAPPAAAASWHSVTTSPQTFTGIEISSGNGSKTLCLFARDATGNVSPAHERGFTLAIPLPVIDATLFSPANGHTKLRDVSYTLSGCGAGWGMLVKLNDAAPPTAATPGWSACSDGNKAFSYAGSEGVFSLHVWAKSDLGYVSASAERLDFQYDVTAPSISLSQPTVGAVERTAFRPGETVLFSWSVTEPNPTSQRTLRISYDAGVTWTTLATSHTGNAFSWTVPDLDGNDDPLATSGLRFEVETVDLAGNVGSSQTSSLIVDRAPPLLTPSFTGGLTTTKSLVVSVDVAATDPVPSAGGVAVVFAEKSGGACPAAPGTGWSVLSGASATFSGVPISSGDGLKTLCVYARDAVGNLAVPSEISITLDQTGPVLGAALVSPSSGVTKDTSVTFALSGCESGSSYIVVEQSTAAPAVAAAGWQPCVNGNKVHDVVAGEGGIDLRVWGKDALGNVAASGALVSLVRDLTAPAITFDAPAGSFRPGASANVSFRVTEPHVAVGNAFAVEYAADGATFASIGSVTGVAGPHSNRLFGLDWSLPGAVVNSRTAKVRVVYSDLAGNVATVAGAAFTVDGSAPAVSTLRVNGATASTSSNSAVALSFSVTDHADGSPVSFVCAKYGTVTSPPTAPSVGDSCWASVASLGMTPGTAVSVASMPFTVGMIAETYHVFVWARDAAGNISTNSGVVGTDKAGITIAPGNAPTIVWALAANAPAVSANPPTNAERVFELASTVHVKWKASDADGNLAASPISLFYTSDELTFTPVPGGAGLLNGSNGGCVVDEAATAVDDGATGCFTWSAGAPTAGYFRIRVVARDADGLSSTASTTPLNEGNLRLLAGRLDSGLGGSAKAALFRGAPGVGTQDLQGFVVTNDGTIYFRDPAVGILVVSPSDGLQRVFIPLGEAQAGDGGPASAATVLFPRRLTLDYQNGLLIYDWDRIRRVDLNQNPPTITTLIGGGANTGPLEAPLALRLRTETSVSVAKYNNGQWWGGFLKALPNGDVWFQDGPTGISADGNARFRVYEAGTGLVRLLVLSGSGTSVTNVFTLEKCPFAYPGLVFDKTTSVVSMFYGKIDVVAYAPGCQQSGGDTGFPVRIHPGSGALVDSSYPPATPYGYGYHFTWAESSMSVVGMDGKLYSYLTEPTDGRSSAKAYDAVANSWSALAGSGNIGTCADGVVATVCPMRIHDMFVTEQGRVYFNDNGRIRLLNPDGTLSSLAGVGIQGTWEGSATLLNLGPVGTVRLTNAGEIFFSHSNSIFVLGGAGSVTRVSGNGVFGIPNTVDPASGQPQNLGGSFALDPGTGDIYAFRDLRVMSRIERATGRWVDVKTVTGPPYIVHNPVYRFSNGKVLFYNFWESTTDNQARFWELDVGSGAETVALGSGTKYTGTGSPLVSCPDMTPTTSCTLSTAFWTPLSVHYDATLAPRRFHFSEFGSRNVRLVMMGGVVDILDVTDKPIQGFAMRTRMNGGTPEEVLDYCALDGRLYERNLANGTEVELPWSIPKAKCAGASLEYDAARGRLVFGVTSLGQAGLAEYVLTD